MSERAALPFVGREEELAVLTAALDRACRGAGSTHVLAGEAGVGKTRVSEALCALARARGAETVRTGEVRVVRRGSSR